MKIVLAQINPTVGDTKGNYNKITKIIDKYYKKADLIVLPELSMSGYPPEDLVLKTSFLLEINHYIEELRRYIFQKNVAVILGAPIKKKTGVYNSGIFIYKKTMTIINKNSLPNYGVFDEERVFKKGKKYNTIKYKNKKIGLLICEDMWFDTLPRYLKKKGAKIFICINASPYENEKLKLRKEICSKIVRRDKVSLIYINQVGGQDELVFDGNSFIMNTQGDIIEQCKGWKEDIKVVNLSDKKNNKYKTIVQKKNEFNTWSGLTIGLKDYYKKNSFNKIVLGLSGGIDSAVSAAIAVDAVGSKNVIGIMMPSKYSSLGSITDAKMTARLLKINTNIFDIKKIHQTFISSIRKHFSNNLKSLTDENLQSRIRGSILMAFSNNFSYLLISTGNKSEMSVGYSTIYGDMNGGFNVLKDVYKTDLYKLAKWRNSLKFKYFKGPKGKVIPINSITKNPSAELKPDQNDTDSLPPYEVLDQILYFLIEKELSVKEIIQKGFEEDTVKKVSFLVFKSEYKRRQAPPGVKLTSKAFGKERIYPITNRYKN
ncbi:MAG: Glutamine-dependent NAD(+) synthetase [Alphaproteobacteria bacterium MarineAlpha9_Bin4]|nr:MAG: Glutamine-dependent NAD(+) synthetase [Alphaproteobacteria bacterium MarineAlpha9_Bin4]